MIVSPEASSKFHRRSFQNEHFARGFLQISHKKLPKHNRSHAQNNARSNSKSSIFFSPQFRAIYPQNPTRWFIQQNQNARLAATACHPKFQNVRFATAACVKMYETSARRPQRGTEKSQLYHSFERPTSTK